MRLVPAIWAAIAMASAGMADAFLYAYLPMNASKLGLSSISLGLILSVNKFSRFFFNRWVNIAAGFWGIKTILIAAMLLAALTSWSYAFQMPLWLWLLSRLGWGAAYSALRFASVQSIPPSPTMGSTMGMSTAVRESGPVLAYWIGPVVLSTWGSQMTFVWSALLPLLVLPVICLLPLFPVRSDSGSTNGFQTGTWLDAWTFSSSYVVEGLLIVTLGVLLGTAGLFTAAVYISLRRIFQIVLAPPSGWLMNKTGHIRVFICSGILFIPAIILIATGWVRSGVLIIFLASAVNNVSLPMFALDSASPADNYNRFTRLSTSKDLGSALGALSGIVLLERLSASLLFTLLAVALSIVFYQSVNYIRQYGTDPSNTK